MAALVSIRRSSGAFAIKTKSCYRPIPPLQRQLFRGDRVQQPTRVIKTRASGNGHSPSADELQYSVVAGLTDAQLYSNLRLSRRHESVLHYFPNALGIDDFIARVEVALCGFGFTGQNSIAMTNLCRDEVTAVLKDKIEAVFGGSFNTNGLGAVLTCGVTGIKAGLSHSPVCRDQRERYVFFSFPHIAIDMNGELGGIYRPNRPGRSCACGALQKALIELKSEGVMRATKIPGVHDPLDPEFTILKQRLARRIRYEHTDVQEMDLAHLTEAAERVITDDLEYLIEKSVSIDQADFAVVSGIQIHNWSGGPHATEPSLEFIAPTKVYVVVGGQAITIDLMQLPSLTPRQMSILAKHGPHGQYDGDAAAQESTVSSCPVASTLVGFTGNYAAQKMGAGSGEEEVQLPKYTPLPRLPRRRVLVSSGCRGPSSSLSHNSLSSADFEDPLCEPDFDAEEPITVQGPTCTWPSWQTRVQKLVKQQRDPRAPTMDGEDSPHTSFTLRGLVS